MNLICQLSVLKIYGFKLIVTLVFKKSGSELRRYNIWEFEVDDLIYQSNTTECPWKYDS